MTAAAPITTRADPHAHATRLLFVVTALTYGGAELQVAELARRLARRGREVTVASMVPPEALVAELEAEGVYVASLGMRPGIPDPRAIARLALLVRRRRPHVVHSHMVHANVLARATRLVAPAPVLVSTAHNIIEGPRWTMLAYRLSDPLSELTTNVSREAAEVYRVERAAPAAKLRWLPNGIDTERFAPNAEARARLRAELELDGRVAVLHVGRFEPQKDHSTLIEAFALLHRERPQTVLLLAGQGPLEEETQALALALGLGGAVRFLGVRQDVPALMSAVDLFVLSSRWEGLPLTLLEASASGLPIVATEVGGNGEIVIDGVSGHLVAPQDPRKLAAALARTADLTAADRRRMGNAGREHVEANFAFASVVDRWERVYDGLLQCSGSSPRRFARRGALLLDG